jgi:hypothetical protein
MDIVMIKFSKWGTLRLKLNHIISQESNKAKGSKMTNHAASTLFQTSVKE